MGWSVIAINGDQLDNDSRVGFHWFSVSSLLPHIPAPWNPIAPKTTYTLIFRPIFGETQSERIVIYRMGFWSQVILHSDVKNKFFTDGNQMLVTLGTQAISNTKTFVYVDWNEVQIEGKTLGY